MFSITINATLCSIPVILPIKWILQIARFFILYLWWKCSACAAVYNLRRQVLAIIAYPWTRADYSNRSSKNAVLYSEQADNSSQLLVPIGYHHNSNFNAIAAALFGSISSDVSIARKCFVTIVQACAWLRWTLPCRVTHFFLVLHSEPISGFPNIYIH